MQRTLSYLHSTAVTYMQRSVWQSDDIKIMQKSKAGKHFLSYFYCVVYWQLNNTLCVCALKKSV